MGVYFRAGADGLVELAGQVCDEAMKDRGYRWYDGDVPSFDAQEQVLVLSGKTLTVKNRDKPVQRIPTVVTIRQAKRALLAVELLNDVEAIMASDAIDRATKIDWENAIEVHREWVEQSGLMSALKMSDAQLDQLFALAATL